MDEKSLHGGVCHVNGVLPMANLARQEGSTSLFVPVEGIPEAALIGGPAVYPLNRCCSLGSNEQQWPRLCVQFL